MQLVAPLRAAKWPAAHAVHKALLALTVPVVDAARVAFVLPAAAQVPAAHGTPVHAVRTPAAAACVPAVQAVHAPMLRCTPQYCPAGQEPIHSVAAASLTLPAGHTVQLMAPPRSANRPTAQAVHVASFAFVLPAAAQLPAAHGVPVHVVRSPAVAAYVPAGQGVQCVALPGRWRWPAGQVVVELPSHEAPAGQVVHMPVPVFLEPMAHMSAQLLAPAALYLPSAHRVQAVRAPASIAYVPAGQGAQPSQRHAVEAEQL